MDQAVTFINPTKPKVGTGCGKPTSLPQLALAGGTVLIMRSRFTASCCSASLVIPLATRTSD